jgi:hypothetical protein
VLVCQADKATICRRLVARAGDERTTSDARLDIWPALRAAYSVPIELLDAVTLDRMASSEAVVAQAPLPRSSAVGDAPTHANPCWLARPGAGLNRERFRPR